MTARHTDVLRRLQLRHWVLVLLTSGLVGYSGRAGVGGVLWGGGMIGASVLVYSLGLGALMGRGRPILAIALLFAKLALLLGVVWWALSGGPGARRPDPIGFAMGLTCFPVAAVWEALRGKR